MKVKELNKWLSAFATCYIIFFEYVNYFVHAVFRVINFKLGFTTALLVAIMLAFLTYLIVTNFVYGWRALVFPIIVACLYYFSIMSNHAGAEHITKSITEKLFLYCIPTYIVIYLITDYKIFYKMLEYFCIGILCSQSLSIFCMTYLPHKFVETDYQGISYGLLIPFIFFVCKEKYNSKIITLISITAFLLLFFGGRGPILCAFICVFYKLCLNVNKNKGWIFILALGSLSFFLMYESILDVVISISKENNFAGSILKYAESGDIFSDSGRGDILNYARQMIADYPMGKGFGSTRHWLGEYGFKYGNYPHNIFYEIWCDFGVAVGSLIICILIAYIYKTFQSRKINPEATAMFEICFFSSGFLILLFSASYILCPLFFAMIAVIQRITADRRARRAK